MLSRPWVSTLVTDFHAVSTDMAQRRLTHNSLIFFPSFWESFEAVVVVVASSGLMKTWLINSASAPIPSCITCPMSNYLSFLQARKRIKNRYKKIWTRPNDLDRSAIWSLIRIQRWRQTWLSWPKIKLGFLVWSLDEKKKRRGKRRKIFGEREIIWAEIIDQWFHSLIIFRFCFCYRNIIISLFN